MKEMLKDILELAREHKWFTLCYWVIAALLFSVFLAITNPSVVGIVIFLSLACSWFVFWLYTWGTDQWWKM